MNKLYMIAILLSLIFISSCSVSMNNEKQKISPAENFSFKEDSLLTPSRILNIAHRGASAYAPEHTINAYKKVDKLGADYIEIDLQMTKDGELVAMHDADVSRTTDGEGKVYELSVHDIKALDAGQWFNSETPSYADPTYNQLKVPTLREIFKTFGKRANYYIELKDPDQSPGMVKELVAVLDEYGMIDADMKEGQVIIQSFSKTSLKKVQKMEPSLPLIQLLHYNQKAAITDEQLKEISTYAVGIGVNFTYVTKEYIRKVRNKGLLLHLYTVNEKKEMKALIEYGATGIFTDYPDRLSEVLKESESVNH